ncbi:formylglycine-generating enzyme required for sulfatase activity [Catenuloplanes nepalensis]|uniref:Formylglycine-generating enzyme required for sulfatase activity n=2 Tax=Catenuloplanes nepalensis TaxID=587533 RepID=A0ABT9MXJ2_9ACTN|nr:formylglycine-generating enzyme required for sulfatase activity [Catenuloplanes nepalensis]
MDTSERMIAVPACEGLASFRLAALPVTRGLYAEIIGRCPADGGDDRLPVTGVTWWDTVLFCNALSARDGLAPVYRVDAGRMTWDRDADGYRLPSEAEWEHACRAGSSGPHYGPLDEVAWFRDNSGDRLRTAGGKAPNAWGFHDMLGNVWDWCWDAHDGGYRVMRGGGWFDERWSCRASARRRSHPSLMLDDAGFRVARST